MGQIKVCQDHLNNFLYFASRLIPGKTLTTSPLLTPGEFAQLLFFLFRFLPLCDTSVPKVEVHLLVIDGYVVGFFTTEVKSSNLLSCIGVLPEYQGHHYASHIWIRGDSHSILLCVND